MLKELIEHIVKTLVDDPSAVAVTVTSEEGKIAVRVTVGDLDLGRVIGKDGQTIRAIRSLALAVAPEGQEVTVDVSK
jgi:predicted RNA-binding protein YlqC (UPF0109 family)